MELLSIQLSARRGNWQRYRARKANKAFLSLMTRVLNRDEHTCRFCGFQAMEYQQVVNIDQNYQNQELDNLATACGFCAQCFFLDAIGLDGKTGGFVIYLPEVTQADLNHFCRALFCSMLRDAPYKGKLQAAYLSLQERGRPVDEFFGPQSSDPLVFGQTIIDAQLSPEQQNRPFMQQLRLLPARKYFKEEIAYWKATVFAKIPL